MAVFDKAGRQVFSNLAEYILNVVPKIQGTPEVASPKLVQWGDPFYKPSAGDRISYGTDAAQQVTGILKFLENVEQPMLDVASIGPTAAIGRAVGSSRTFSPETADLLLPTQLYADPAARQIVRQYAQDALNRPISDQLSPTFMTDVIRRSVIDTMPAEYVPGTRAFSDAVTERLREIAGNMSNAQRSANEIVEDRFNPSSVSNAVRQMYQDAINAEYALPHLIRGIVAGRGTTGGAASIYTDATAPLESALRLQQYNEVRPDLDIVNSAKLLAREVGPQGVTPAAIIQLGTLGITRADVESAIRTLVGMGEEITPVNVQTVLRGKRTNSGLRSAKVSGSLAKRLKLAQARETWKAEQQLLKAEKRIQNRVAQERGATEASKLPRIGATPAERRLNQLLDQLLTPAEKAGLDYMTPEQQGEFIQKVLRERAPGYGA